VLLRGKVGGVRREVRFVWPFIRDLARIAFTPRVIETCKDCGLPSVFTVMLLTTYALSAASLRAQLYFELTFYVYPEILSSCDLVEVVFNSNHGMSLVYNFRDGVSTV
jgi:hypothetical protein